MATTSAGDGPPNEDMVRRSHPPPPRRARVPYTSPDNTPHMYQKLCLGCALTPLSRVWQMQLPPIAEPRPPPPPPEKLDEQWKVDRLNQTLQFLDWMVGDSLRGGVKFLSRAHGEDTRAKAQELLEKALRSCAAETDEKPTGNPVLWAILLTQQAHALQYSAGGELLAWEVAERPERWGVREMHKRMRERQSQRMALERGSRAPRDTRTVGRGLVGAQRVRDLQAPTPPTHAHTLPGLSPPPPWSLRAAGRPHQRGCAHACAPRGRARW